MTTPLDTMKSAVLGVPFDANKKPSRQGVIKAFAEMQKQIEATQSGALVKDTLAALQSITTVDELSTMAWVVNDSVTANNGIYESTDDASNVVWVRRNDIPQFLVTATHDVSSSANALVVETDLPIPDQDARCLIIIPVTAVNTDSVTIAINDVAAIPILKNSNLPLEADDLQVGMMLLGVISGGNFVLISDIFSENIALRAEQAAASAEESANAAANGIDPTQGLVVGSGGLDTDTLFQVRNLLAGFLATFTSSDFIQLVLQTDDQNRRIVAKDAGGAVQSQIILEDGQIEMTATDLLAGFLAIISGRDYAQLVLQSDAENRRIVAKNDSDVIQSQIILEDGQLEMTSTDALLGFIATIAGLNYAQMILKSDNENRRIVATNASGDVQSQIIMRDSNIEFTGSNEDADGQSFGRATVDGFAGPESIQFWSEAVIATDASVDVSATVSAWLTGISDKGKAGKVQGQYRLDSRSSLALDGTVPGDHIQMFGGGQNEHGFWVNNSDGGLQFTYTGAGRQQSVEVHDMHFEPMLGDSGCPLEIDFNSGGHSVQCGVIIKGVTFGPLDDGSATTEAFSEGLKIAGAHRPLLDNIRFTQGISSAPKVPAVVDISDCYYPVLKDVWINVTQALTDGDDTTGGAAVGFLSHGFEEEAIDFYNCVSNGADIGVDWERDGREAQFRWTNGHVNALTIGMRLNGVKYGKIVAPTMYMDKIPSAHVGDVIDFKIEDAEGLSIIEPDFRYGVGLQRRHFHLEPKAGKTGAVVRNIRIVLGTTSLFANTTVAPIYCNGATRVEIVLPDDTNTEDFVSYPNNLIEMGPNQNPAEIKITTSSGHTQYDNSNTVGPKQIIDRVSDTPAGADYLGETIYRGRDDAGNKTDYVSLRARILDPTNATEDGFFDIKVLASGNSVQAMRYQPGSVQGETMIFIGVRGADEDTYTLERVSVGANDSGGAGKRLLTIPNS